MARFTINNLDEFAFDRYASHIIRTCLQCAAGVRVAANVARSKKATPAAKTVDDKSDEQAWILISQGFKLINVSVKSFTTS